MGIDSIQPTVAHTQRTSTKAHEQRKKADSGGDDLLTDDLLGDDLLSGDLLVGEVQDDDLFGKKTTPNENITVEGSAWVSFGGWYQNGEGLYYRPGDHPDGFLSAWSTRLELDVFDKILSAGCDKCHLPQEKGPRFRAPYSGGSHGVFTVFDHAAHVAIMKCDACHEAVTDRAPGKSSFAAMKLDSCRICHGAQDVTDDCMSCHNYHVTTETGSTGSTTAIASPKRP